MNNNQLFKFKHIEGENLTAVSEILNRAKASPGVYDTKLGNEIRDSYSIIEAEEYVGIVMCSYLIKRRG